LKFFATLFGGPAPARPAAPNSSLGDSGHSQSSAGSSSLSVSTHSNRRELLRVVLRDTLRRGGIPADWITAEVMASMSRQRTPGVFWRLMIRHWDERLPNHCVALQNALITRLHMFDPLAEEWLTGISWQFVLADESHCPALPHPGAWTAVPRDAAAPAEAAAMDSGDVIAGPVSIRTHSGDTKADLERLMSVMDAQYHRDESTARGYAQTQPAKL